jgi:hypothetical protein
MEIEGDAIDGLRDSVASAELHLQLVDLEQQTVDGFPDATGVEELDVGRSAGSR